MHEIPPFFWKAGGRAEVEENGKRSGEKWRDTPKTLICMFQCLQGATIKLCFDCFISPAYYPSRSYLERLSGSKRRNIQNMHNKARTIKSPMRTTMKFEDSVQFEKPDGSSTIIKCTFPPLLDDSKRTKLIDFGYWFFPSAQQFFFGLAQRSRSANLLRFERPVFFHSAEIRFRGLIWFCLQMHKKSVNLYLRSVNRFQGT